MVLTKSDFLLYLDAPIHLWASKHDHLTKQPLSDYDQHLMKQGYEVEKLAHEFINQTIASDTKKLHWQETYNDGLFQVRTDALIFDESANVYDLYEIKSSSEVDKINIYDVTFQALILEDQISLRNIFVITLNKEYVRQGPLDITQLFSVVLVDELVDDKREETLILRKDALKVMQLDTQDSLEPCVKPKTCPCVDVCHPDLPDYSIYDIARIKKDKILQLKANKIISIHDVPADFALSGKQRKHVDVAQSGLPEINQLKIAQELASFQYPLHFFDYETYNAAVPPHDGYRPYQQMVFQYSLHSIDENGQITHAEYVADTEGDSALLTSEHLKENFAETGTVLVWNKSFEMSRNTEMAERYPDLADFLLSINNRVYDLGDIFSKDMYIHPGFKGSWSIKNVLPVLVPELSYKDLEIGKGDQAMLSWWEMRNGTMSEIEKENIKQSLLKYCELDTWAMVEIWRKLKGIDAAI